MFKFRKIASVLASTVMVGSTLAIAAASTFPAPFVQNGSANVAIVYGANAPGGLDLAQVTDITTKLSVELGKQTASGSSPTSVVGGDFVKLERSTDKFNLGDNTAAFYTTLDEGEFSKVLAQGTYLNDANNEYEYEQSITPAAITLAHFQDIDFNDNKPVIGFALSSGDSVLNYTLDFTPDAAEGGTNFADLENTELEMLGKSFFISDVTTTSNGVKMTLLDSANTVLLAEGETKTVPVGSKSYEVSVESLSGSAASPKTKLTVNGETTNSLSEGQTFKLKDGTYVGIKDISMRDVAGTTAKVEFSLGSGQIVLENGQEVEVNSNPVSDIEDANGYTSYVYSYITNSSTDISSIKLEWKVADDAIVAPGADLTMPGFNTIKFSMGGFVSPGNETTSLRDNSDSVELKTTVKDGSLTLPILYANSTVTGFAGMGKKSSEKLVTNGSTSPRIKLNETDKSYFVATWISGDDSESYAFQLDGSGAITLNDGKNSTELKNLASGGKDLKFAEVGDTEDIGQLRFTLVSASKVDKVATISVAPAGSGSAYADRLVTKEGLTMRLPVNSVATGEGNLNLTGDNPTSWSMGFTEENGDAAIQAGKSFSVTLGVDAGDGTEPTATNVSTIETADDSNVYEGYVVSDIATKVVFDNPSSDLGSITINYPGQESYADVYLSEVAASVTTGGEPISLGSVSVTDAEVASASAKNLIVVGGSCVNTVAAQLLGVSAGTCGAAFTDKTGIAANQALIQTFSYSGKVATLVAGFNAGDTAMAAKYLTTQGVDTTVGKKYVVTSETTATASAA